MQGSKPEIASYRSWYAYDSSALFDAQADTLIEPGENGVLYTVKLNTKFDKTAGTLSINPDAPIKVNYSAPAYKDTGTAVTTPLWGMEDSACAWKNYLYVTDNGGKLFCWDLNTMKLVWVQNVLDDTNDSPVFSEENGHGYIYISTSLHETAKTTAAGRTGGIPIWKIDAATGAIVWKTDPYQCYTVLDVSGGVQDTPVLGQNDISNLVVYAIARTPSAGSGIIVALDKNTGKEVWRRPTNHYMWSSPVAVYTPSGKSYIVACDTVGNMFLLDGKTGTIVDTLNLGANIEASPAVFDDTIVIGTRGQKIYGININKRAGRRRSGRERTDGEAQDHRDRPRPLQRVRSVHHRLRRGRPRAGRRGQSRLGEGALLRRYGHVPERLPHRCTDRGGARGPCLRLPGHRGARQPDPRRGGCRGGAQARGGRCRAGRPRPLGARPVAHPVASHLAGGPVLPRRRPAGGRRLHGLRAGQLPLRPAEGPQDGDRLPEAGRDRALSGQVGGPHP
jgi:outer membrane protein assembly factor BamB